MKLKPLLISSLLTLAPNLSHAEQGLFNRSGQLARINKSLVNLGLYLGNWNLANAPSTNSSASEIWKTLSSSLTNVPSAQIATIAMTTALKASGQFWDNTASTYSGYSHPDISSSNSAWNSSKEEHLSVLPLLDQQAYQPLPTQQLVQNILSSPPSLLAPDAKGYDSYMDYDTGITDGRKQYCSASTLCIFPSELIENAGGIQYKNLNKLNDAKIYDIFGSQSNTRVLPSLSFDSLIAPVSYSTENTNKNNDDDDNYFNGGLFGETGITQADAFVRYVSGMLIPVQKSADLEEAVKSLNKTKSPEFSTQFKNAAAINSYIVKLRSFAAQASVGSSNFYYLLSKRVPVKDGDGQPIMAKDIDGTEHPLTQQKEEMKMALKRLQSIPSGKDEQETSWMKMIQTADPARVQRETAILLAEMNYQMYLNRQMQERMLATMSAMQLQLLTTAKKAVTFQKPQ